MINANKDYLKSFFNGNLQYEVPFFQRAYIWNEENWEILWENVYDVFKDYLDNRNNEHFIGTLIIKQRPAQLLGENIYDLVDGQQRLTTFAILLKTLADTCKGSLPRLREKIMDLIVYENTRGEHFLRIIHNHVDRPYFEKILWNDLTTIQAQMIDIDNKIVQAYFYFLEKVNNLEDDDRDILKDLILNKVPIISMLISAEDDEQEIFDTINSLGVKLTTAELLKNYIFKENGLRPLYNSHWNFIYEIDEERIDFWNKDKTSGRVIRTNVEILLYCYLIIQTRKEVKLEKLYKEYKTWLTGQTIESKRSFLESLKAYAEIYYSFPEGEELNEFDFSNKEKRFFHIIENLSITTIYPLVLFLYNEIHDPETRMEYIEFLESYMVRRNICKLTTKNYNNLFISILQKLIEHKNEEDGLTIEKFKNIFYEFDDDTNLFPSDELLEEAFHNSVLTNQNSKEILYCIELYNRYNDLSDVRNLSSTNFSVEHILPKKWEENWTETPMTDTEKSIRNKKLLTLGNLTLLTKKLNSTLKNNSWQIKKNTLLQYSSLKITTNYINLTSWNEDTITSRANDLFDVAKEIWKD